MPIAEERILFADDHLLAVSKLSGELVVRGKGSVGKLPLLDFLKRDYPGLRAVHRLDFETSGALVFARTKAAHEQILSSKFLGWRKAYRMIVVGTLKRESGVIDRPLPARGKGEIEAVTHYRALETFGNAGRHARSRNVSFSCSLVEAEIETGRHHQIRRHFAAIRHPLVLDRVYGDATFNQKFSQAFGYRKFFLHAVRLELPHPITGEKLAIEAPMPRSFEEALKKLRIEN